MSKQNKSLHFIDFEVFEKDWLCVIVDPFNNNETVIVNDKDALNDYYEKHIDEIFIGYNIRKYDQFIFKAILLGLDVKKVNDEIIVNGKQGHEICDLFYQIPLIFYDAIVFTKSLKTLEAYLGHDIRESEVDFRINIKLTQEEIDEVVSYCKNDVYELINVFSINFSEFEAATSLITAFNHPVNCISKTKSQLSALTLECHRQERNDEWDLYAVDTIKLTKYLSVKYWFMDKNNHDYEKYLEMNVAGVKHKFAWGGIHGAKEKYHAKGNIWHVDVASFYPSLMIVYDLLSRNVSNKDKYKTIKDKRLAYKAEKNKLQKPYKIVLNGTYGICKDKYSTAYDPRNANLVCVNGQLLLLDLIEKLEDKLQGFELIQSNTDGLIIKFPEEYNDVMKAICREWMDRSGCELEFDSIDEIWQKDVNNYIFRFTEKDKNGNDIYERKGAYVKENSLLDNDLPIINEALFKYFTEGIPVKDTINNCNELIKFQKIYRRSEKIYLCAWHKDKFLYDNTFRVFASKDQSDTYIGKMKHIGGNIDQFALSPNHCFIDNSDIRGKQIPSNLDKQWYIDKAEYRASLFCNP